MTKIGDITINSKLALAPMAGVTDLAFRSICREMGAALTYTEMVSAKALVYQDSKTKELLKIAENEHPVAAQIFGSEPECMAQAAVKAIEISGADIIDINMGCPVGKVVKSGDGCALMKDTEKARRIIEAVVNELKSKNIPVSVKIRKGWDKGNVNAVEFAQMAQSAGAAMIAVHGRTKMQMYSGRADWDIIREVKNAINIPVIANGDIMCADDVVRILKYTGADMAMIARGAMGNPWIFKEAAAILDGKELPKATTITERADLAMRQIEMTAAVKGEHKACMEARRHFAWYLRGIHNATFYKRKVVAAQTIKEYIEIVKMIKEDTHMSRKSI